MIKPPKNIDSIAIIVGSDSIRTHECTIATPIMDEIMDRGFNETYIGHTQCINGTKDIWKVSTNQYPSFSRSKAGKVFISGILIAEGENPLYQQKDFPIHTYVDVTRHFEEIFSPKLNPVEKIISEIQVLDNRGFHKNAMSKLNSFIFELYLEENIKEVNFLISYFLNGEFSIELLITLARISKPHREKLSNRSSLIEVLENRLKEECTIIEAKNILFHVS
jgi:hypothetical protein